MINHPNRAKPKNRALDFTKIKVAISHQFERLTQHDMFCVDADKDVLWDTYIGAFPAGTNPMLRKRTEHDCSCCRQFIRAVGNAVAIIDGKVESLWDVAVGDPAYQAVVDAMALVVKEKRIVEPFLFGERSAGTDRNFEQKPDEPVRTWQHFHVAIPHGRNQGKNYFCVGSDIPTKLGEARALHDVLLRSLEELTGDAVGSVLELIAQNSLYRGQEHHHAVESFAKLQADYAALPPGQRDIFVWSKIDKVPAAVAKIRNTAIGTLLIDLSAGLALEDAVRKFEVVVAPTNYKRSTALVTKAMVEAARAKIKELGLEDALNRRYARLEDISVNDIIFADRSARKAMRDVFDTLATKAAAPKNLAKVETVTIEKFISDIVPHVDKVELFFENRHAANLMSLIAPADKHAASLFKWDNGFSWSYSGDVADSLRERVKKAGGNVTGDLCCRLAWYNFDDLDFHMVEPGGFEICFYNRRSPMEGQLDVDMNAGGGRTREPVENIFYTSKTHLREGIYKLFVKQYARREPDDIGFEVEIDWLGDVTRYGYAKAMRTGENVLVARFEYSRASGVKIIEALPSSGASRKLWGLDTQGYQPVNLMLLSPNHWGGHGVGNRHYFFMLRDCANDGEARGFYNEFLRPELDKHRKVLDMVGSKMKAEKSENQLSGLGFSDTQRAELLVRVSGNITRTLKVTI
jgi:hypothetical protein